MNLENLGRSTEAITEQRFIVTIHIQLFQQVIYITVIVFIQNQI